MSQSITPETDVPAGEEPAARCRHCDQPFRAEHYRDLHLGTAHEAALTEEEQEAYLEAVEEEDEELFVYHLKIVAAIAVTYAIFVVVYMVVLGGSG